MNDGMSGYSRKVLELKYEIHNIVTKRRGRRRKKEKP